MPATLEQLHERIKSGQYDNAELLGAFADILFDKTASEFLEQFDAETLLAIAVSALEFIGRKPAKLRVRVYNPSYQADGWEVPYTVLEVNLKDRPFIVDSLRAELRRQGYELHYLLHPILSVKRDAEGHITALSGERDGEGTRESYELYLLGREDDPDKRLALESAVETVLRDVVLATGDYKAMREKARELEAYLEEAGKDAERAEELAEDAAFMAWLDQDNYVFLGYREYDITELGGVAHLQLAADSALGIFRKVDESAYRQPVPLRDIPTELRERITGGEVLIVTKTNAEATVHRAARMDYIGIKKLGEKGRVLGEQRFVGLFTSKALSQPVEEIPILRRKLRQVLELDRAIPGSHDFKEIVSLFNSIPREELFWSDAARLHRDIRTIMDLAKEHEVRLTLRPDPLGRGLAVMVIMPRERFNSEVRREIQEFLFAKLEATHVDYHLAVGEGEEQVRFHFFFTTRLESHELDVRELEHEVAELTRSWDDHLTERLVAVKGELPGKRLADRYLAAFDERYKADTSDAAALRDIDNLEALGEAPYQVDLLNPLEERQGERATHLKIYHRQRALILSEVLPVLENLGFKVLEQISYSLQLGETLETRGVDIFRVQDSAGELLDVRKTAARLIEALQALLRGQATNDRLNRLVLYGGLTIRQVALLRSYQAYYSQLNAVTSRGFINATLLAHPELARLLYQAFEGRFDPSLEGDRNARWEEHKTAFLDGLTAVSSLPEDRCLRGLLNLVEATVRSNFFLNKDYLSFKLDSARVESMPEPRPLFEVGVSSPTMEGVHLRGGRVARGGIRWSDRPDDFRTEVLGLMKTQMTKNAVIVPVGSKGGFVIKGTIKNASEGLEALRRHVREQYQTLMRGLLDLTDNLVAGETVHPKGLVIYDGPDPYLVVAADKGTASFSDLANETAAEYNFWLGDAFASGGSHGYDHKKEGITARGAWECVKRHFHELGINIFEDTFTAVGIGDMSGDVFGNGMLYTDKIKLQAAFNHLHIFLDPNPDPARSYAERKRLFELPRSTWEDYDTSLVSEGGGIYSRFAKEIPLSPQARETLGVTAEVLTGQELIQAILKAPVDLLWNGGIGTYVKASSERNADVGDSGNDAVRIDASELRARVVGEGGNLGFTQLARIEYALAGGKINTDAIDNSAGVDMSDHEVNIKILLQPLVAGGELSFVQRNRLLKEMTEEVSALVLHDNDSQSLCLSLGFLRSREDIDLFESLMEYLSGRGDLKPQVEFLPARKEVEERHRAHRGFTRPELAILLAYTKMGIHRRLLETDFPDEPHFQHYLFDYFPKVLQERFGEGIKGHQLRREIIATQFTNTVVDLLGIAFVHRSIRDSGASPVEVIRAALVALEILDVNPFLARLAAAEQSIEAEAFYEALDEMVRAVEGIVNWMLLSDINLEPIAAFVTTYRAPLAQLGRYLKTLLPRRERESYKKRQRTYLERGFPEALASELAGFAYLPSGMGVVDVSRATSTDPSEAAKHFYTLGERLALGWLRDSLVQLPGEDKWDKIAQGGLVVDLRRVQRHLTVQYLNELREQGRLKPEAFLEAHPRLLKRYDQSLREIKEGGLNLASGGVLARILQQILEESRRAQEAVVA